MYGAHPSVTKMEKAMLFGNKISIQECPKECLGKGSEMFPIQLHMGNISQTPLWSFFSISIHDIFPVINIIKGRSFRYTILTPSVIIVVIKIPITHFKFR